MVTLPAVVRREVIARAAGYCEYCRAPLDVVVELEVDHIVPVAAGGGSEADNLCVACAGCNRFKAAYQDGTDPDTGQSVPLFDPRRQQWRDHFAWDVDRAHVVGQTSTGRATVARLRMNRARMVVARQLWIATGLFPPDDDRLQDIVHQESDS